MCGLVILRQRCLQRMLVALLLSLYPFCIAMGQFDLEEAPLPPTPPPQILKLASDDEDASDSDADDSQPLDKEYEALSKVLEDLKKNDPARAAKLERELLSTIRRVKRSIAPAADSTTSSPIRIAPILPVQENSNSAGIRFEVAKQEFQLLRTAGDPANAARLEQQLVALEQGLQAGEYDFASSSDPEVHLVSLRGGSTLPKQYRTKENQYRLGFAEVHVRYRARPIILVLRAAESVLWKIKLDEGAQVYAVVTDSVQPQEIVGLSNPLVINSKAAIENGLYRPLSQFGRLQDSGIGIAGEYPVSEYKADKFDGEPIVLGAANKRWLSSYFVHLVEDLIDESRIVRRNLRLPAIKELRFTSTFISPSPFGPSGQPPQSNSGNFNIVGPIASSLRPLRHSQLRQSIVISDENENADEKEHLEFGLDLGGRLVVLQSTDIPDRLTPVPPPANAVVGSASRFRTLAYDSSRNRLILATNAGNVSSIVCFDVEEAEWSKLASLPHPVLAMTYVPAEDQIWAVVSRHQNGGQLRETADFLRIGSDGAIISEKRISEPLGEEQRDRNGHAYFGSMWDQAFPQLVEANNFALFVGTRNVRHPSAWSSAKPELFVIEPNSAELLYSGELKVNSDEPVDASSLATTAATDSDPRIADSVLGSIHIKLDKAKSVLLEASATDEQQAKLEARLANIRSTLLGQELERTDERVYLIGRYASNQPIRIRLTDTTGPVTLVLSGYQSIDWQVEAAKGVNLTRIIAVGNQKQKVSSKPTETMVELYNGNEGFTIFDARDAVPSGRVAQRIRELTGGLEISAVAAAHQTAVHEMVVGQDEGFFRVQIVDRQLDRLLADAVRSRSDGVLADLDAKRFFAVHQGALPRQAVQASQNKYHWSEFSIRGPIIGRGATLGQLAQYWAYDAAGRKLYLAAHTNLTIWDPQTKKSERINLTGKDRRIGQVSGLAFDSKRNRLIVNARDKIVAFDPAKKSVTTICAKSSKQEVGMIYNAAGDVVYSIATDRSGRNEIGQILRYNAHGVLLDAIKLSTPIRRGRIYSSANTVQVVDLGDYLGLIDYQQERQFRGINGRNMRTSPIGRITVVSLENGEVIYNGKLRPTVEQREISPEELASIWEQLGETNPAELDRLLWDMASGHTATMGFLVERIAEVAPTMDDTQIATHVGNLDDHRFTVRENAFQQLQLGGCAIQEKLTSMLEGNVSPEVRERLQSLLAGWATGEPQNADERRRVRGMEVLARMGSEEARAFIANMQSPQFDAITRGYATRILNGEQNLTAEEAGLQFQQRLFVPQQPR